MDTNREKPTETDMSSTSDDAPLPESRCEGNVTIQTAECMVVNEENSHPQETTHDSTKASELVSEESQNLQSNDNLNTSSDSKLVPKTPEKQSSKELDKESCADLSKTSVNETNQATVVEKFEDSKSPQTDIKVIATKDQGNPSISSVVDSGKASKTTTNAVKLTEPISTSKTQIDPIGNEESNDSQSTSISEASEKEHSRSISRELKSLIKSAKESKIISECTNLQTKVRKSRGVLDSSNTSLNSIGDEEKVLKNKKDGNETEPSDKMSMKRSMRSQNPEFVSKQKQFLNSLSTKLKGDTDSMSETGDSEVADETGKKDSASAPSTPKRKKLNEEKQPLPPEAVPAKPGMLKTDPFCWVCHYAVEQTENEKSDGHCSVCPRSYHYKCLSTTERASMNSDKKWVCPKCVSILQAENAETRSPTMKKVSPSTLRELLTYALKRMEEINGAPEENVFPGELNFWQSSEKFNQGSDIYAFDNGV